MYIYEQAAMWSLKLFDTGYNNSETGSCELEYTVMMSEVCHNFDELPEISEKKPIYTCTNLDKQKQKYPYYYFLAY